MGGLRDSDLYLDHVLVDATPRSGTLSSGAAEQGAARHWTARHWTARHWTAWWRERAGEGDTVVATAARQGFVLTAAQLVALDVARQPIRTAIRRGRWIAPARGVVAPLAVAEPRASPLLTARLRTPWLLRRRRSYARTMS
ncbi:MAG: type IV toxin-antitoxin system AbiEi family antitoxin domain-containing protein [Jatrophihabitans sp.]|uniref:type IV toxin-antitoxin system AbiEi family antitoxin domain-containing protein n=1 Tax=Jatrophihabitans sp. TaxID=1932789 RepID=UPI00390E37EC